MYMYLVWFAEIYCLMTIYKGGQWLDFDEATHSIDFEIVFNSIKIAAESIF